MEGERESPGENSMVEWAGLTAVFGGLFKVHWRGFILFISIEILARSTHLSVYSK